MEDHNDPLSRADFDPVEYINFQFPDEASLSNLDTFVVGVSSKISIVESEISQTVQLHILVAASDFALRIIGAVTDPGSVGEAEQHSQ